MKIIISRKGFDSQYGNQPSPIMPDGTLLSLPIPAKCENIQFSDLVYKDKTYFKIIQELNRNTNLKDKHSCHLDPDLRKDIIRREKDWVRSFGQTGSAQGHLSNNGIREGDLFLFFGWFKEVERKDGSFKYKKNAPDQHIIFGYLQIGKIYSEFSSFPKELRFHPHAQVKYRTDKNNCIYRASDFLSILPLIPGAGCLNFHNDLVLTKKGFSKSKWNLPSLFHNLAISYHSSKSFCQDYFQSASKGQEFIVEENANITDWARKLIICGTIK